MFLDLCLAVVDKVQLSVTDSIVLEIGSGGMMYETGSRAEYRQRTADRDGYNTYTYGLAIL